MNSNMLMPVVSTEGFTLSGATVAVPEPAAAVTRQAGSNFPVPETCEDDFDCNGGRWESWSEFVAGEKWWGKIWHSFAIW